MALLKPNQNGADYNQCFTKPYAFAYLLMKNKESNCSGRNRFKIKKQGHFKCCRKLDSKGQAQRSKNSAGQCGATQLPALDLRKISEGRKTVFLLES